MPERFDWAETLTLFNRPLSELSPANIRYADMAELNSSLTFERVTRQSTQYWDMITHPLQGA